MTSKSSPKRILVVMNRFQGYEKSIPAAIEALGHEVRFSDARPSNSFLMEGAHSTWLVTAYQACLRGEHRSHRNGCPRLRGRHATADQPREPA